MVTTILDRNLGTAEPRAGFKWKLPNAAFYRFDLKRFLPSQNIWEKELFVCGLGGGLDPAGGVWLQVGPAGLSEAASSNYHLLFFVFFVFLVFLSFIGWLLQLSLSPYFLVGFVSELYPSKSSSPAMRSFGSINGVQLSLLNIPFSFSITFYLSYNPLTVVSDD